MRLLVQVLVGISILLSLRFIADVGNPRRSEIPTIAWLLAAWGWVSVAFETLIFVAMFDVDIPLWIAAVVLAAKDGVYTWRIAVVRRARRAGTEDPVASKQPTEEASMAQPTPTPTQTRHPWRATLRTLIAAGLGLASLAPYVLAGAHLDGTALGVQLLAVTGAITRVLAIPGVNAWLTLYVPWLAASPPRKDTT